MNEVILREHLLQVDAELAELQAERAVQQGKFEAAVARLTVAGNERRELHNQRKPLHEGHKKLVQRFKDLRGHSLALCLGDLAERLEAANQARGLMIKEVTAAEEALAHANVTSRGIPATAEQIEALRLAVEQTRNGSSSKADKAMDGKKEIAAAEKYLEKVKAAHEESKRLWRAARKKFNAATRALETATKAKAGVKKAKAGVNAAAVQEEIESLQTAVASAKAVLEETDQALVAAAEVYTAADKGLEDLRLRHGSNIAEQKKQSSAAEKEASDAAINRLEVDLENKRGKLLDLDRTFRQVDDEQRVKLVSVNSKLIKAEKELAVWGEKNGLTLKDLDSKIEARFAEIGELKATISKLRKEIGKIDAELTLKNTFQKETQAKLEALSRQSEVQSQPTMEAVVAANLAGTEQPLIDRQEKIEVVFSAADAKEVAAVVMSNLEIEPQPALATPVEQGMLETSEAEDPLEALRIAAVSLERIEQAVAESVQAERQAVEDALSRMELEHRSAMEEVRRQRDEQPLVEQPVKKRRIGRTLIRIAAAVLVLFGVGAAGLYSVSLARKQFFPDRAKGQTESVQAELRQQPIDLLTKEVSALNEQIKKAEAEEAAKKSVAEAANKGDSPDFVAMANAHAAEGAKLYGRPDLALIGFTAKVGEPPVKLVQKPFVMPDLSADNKLRLEGDPTPEELLEETALAVRGLKAATELMVKQLLPFSPEREVAGEVLEQAEDLLGVLEPQD